MKKELKKLSYLYFMVIVMVLLTKGVVGQTFYVEYNGELYVCEEERLKSASEEVIECYQVNMIGEVLVSAPIITPQTLIPPPNLPDDPGATITNPIYYYGDVVYNESTPDNPGDLDGEAETDCEKFENWVSNYQMGNGTYYKRSDGIKLVWPKALCSNYSWNCPNQMDEWFDNNTDKYYRYSGWKLYNDCNINCLDVYFTENSTTNINTVLGAIPTTSSGSSDWCVFAACAMISYNTACYHATNYHAWKNTGVSKPCLNTGGFLGSWGDMVDFIQMELGIGGIVFDDECWLIQKLKQERRKIFAVIDQPGISVHHAIVVHGIKRERNGKVYLYYRDLNSSSISPMTLNDFSNAFVKYLY